MFSCFLPLLVLPLLAGCSQFTAAVVEKSMSPEVIVHAQQPTSWYSYLPERAPGFCLCTERALIWREPGMNLGHWRGLHPAPPHRVLMEARGDTFILHRHYVWDGMSVGETLPRDLAPSLRHDALYHALKEGAQFSRAEADRAFLRDMRREGVSGAGLDYALIRCFGGLYLKRGDEPTMLVQELSADEPIAPLETPTARELQTENPLPSAPQVEVSRVDAGNSR